MVLEAGQPVILPVTELARRAAVLRHATLRLARPTVEKIDAHSAAELAAARVNVGNLELRGTVLWHLRRDKHGSEGSTHEEIAWRKTLHEKAVLSSHITVKHHCSPLDFMKDATNVDH